MAISISNVYRCVFQNAGGGLKYSDLAFEGDIAAKRFQDYYNTLSDIGRLVYIYRIGSVSGNTLPEENQQNLKIFYRTTDRKMFSAKVPFFDFTITKTKLNNLFLGNIKDFKEIADIRGYTDKKDSEED